MDKTRVIMCRTQVGMGSDGLVNLIQAAPTLSVNAILGKEPLIRELEQERYSVLIGQAGAHSDSDCERYHSIQPDLAILRAIAESW